MECLVFLCIKFCLFEAAEQHSTRNVHIGIVSCLDTGSILKQDIKLVPSALVAVPTNTGIKIVISKLFRYVNNKIVWTNNSCYSEKCTGSKPLTKYYWIQQI